MANGLTAKQQRFVDEYLVDLNATRAAIRAGYSEKTAEVQGPRLLGNVRVSEAIQASQTKQAERTSITADKVLEELARIGFADLRQCFTPGGNLIPVQDWPDSIAHAIGAVEVVTKPGEMDEEGNRPVEYVHKIKLWDKNSALEKIAKHLGMFIERIEHTGKDGQPIEVADRSNKERARRILSLIAQAELDGHD